MFLVFRYVYHMGIDSIISVKCELVVDLPENYYYVWTHTGIFKGCGYSSRLWLQFLKDVATVKNGRFARKFSGKSTTKRIIYIKYETSNNFEIYLEITSLFFLI